MTNTPKIGDKVLVNSWCSTCGLAMTANQFWCSLIAIKRR